jgi:hypothetical protein
MSMVYGFLGNESGNVINPDSLSTGTEHTHQNRPTQTENNADF